MEIVSLWLRSRTSSRRRANGQTSCRVAALFRHSDRHRRHEEALALRQKRPRADGGRHGKAANFPRGCRARVCADEARHSCERAAPEVAQGQSARNRPDRGNHSRQAHVRTDSTLSSPCCDTRRCEREAVPQWNRNHLGSDSYRTYWRRDGGAGRGRNGGAHDLRHVQSPRARHGDHRVVRRAKLRGTQRHLRAHGSLSPHRARRGCAMTPLKDVKVLVVDDNALVLDLLMRGLAPHCEALAAADGGDALLKIVDEPPDLIICDYRMPGLDGRQLYEK